MNACLRTPATVMRLDRMGSAHPTRLSFLRILLRRVEQERWQFERVLWDINEHGVGRAVYCAIGPQRRYSLVAFAHDLPADQRTDRVIANAWDATFALFDGRPTEADIQRLEANVPLQEAGRISSCELSLSRANRSVRLFEHVLERLASGQQPDADEVLQVGYLMRTTAVYGSGKFGAADREAIADRPELAAPFQAELLSVWLSREFSIDLIEHLARARGGTQAVRLQPALRRALGIGNSTGLGMAPFLVRHPQLLNNWMQVREQALMRVRTLHETTPMHVEQFNTALNNAIANAERWRSEHPLQQSKLKQLRTDLRKISTFMETTFNATSKPWDTLWRWGETLSLEGQEALLALMLEPHGDEVDDLATQLGADEQQGFHIDATQSVAEFKAVLEQGYGWALEHDYDSPEASARFWYVSAEKLEPRLGNRHLDEGAAREQPLDIARQVHTLHTALRHFDQEATLSEFNREHPEHRHTIRRVQRLRELPYAEIHDNLIDENMLPIDLIRWKLAYFGATRFDPRSDRWVRISLFQDQPHPSDFNLATET